MWQVLRAAHAIGPSRTLLELAYARHDVFASAEPETVAAARAHLEAWLVGEGLVRGGASEPWSERRRAAPPEAAGG